jgi:hypothetical protein
MGWNLSMAVEITKFTTVKQKRVGPGYWKYFWGGIEQGNWGMRNGSQEFRDTYCISKQFKKHTGTTFFALSFNK